MHFPFILSLSTKTCHSLAISMILLGNLVFFAANAPDLWAVMKFSSHSALIGCSICSRTIITIHLTFSPPGILTHSHWTVQDLFVVDRTQIGKMSVLKEVAFSRQVILVSLHFPDVIFDRFWWIILNMFILFYVKWLCWILIFSRDR